MPERGKYTAVPVMEWAQRRNGVTAYLFMSSPRSGDLGYFDLGKNCSEMHIDILSMQFEHRKVTKTYHAIVDGNLEFNQLLKLIYPLTLARPTSGFESIIKTEKSAQTDISTSGTFSKHSRLMECQPKTGRLHQIRVHLASQNARISADDELYGGIIPLLVI